jgi:hypothetical protein
MHVHHAVPHKQLLLIEKVGLLGALEIGQDYIFKPKLHLML